MPKRPPRREGSKTRDSFEKYGVGWSPMSPDLWIEMQMIHNGGEFTKSDGSIAGLGLFYHFKEALKLSWPHFVQHRWFDLMLKEWIAHTYIGLLGPKDSGKSAGMAVIHLMDYYCNPSNTLCLFSSTSKESLENRVWGEVKTRHREAKAKFSWLPGHLIEGRLRIVTSPRDDVEEGRDFRCGFAGIPMKKGSAMVGMDSIIGIKQKRKRWFIDEIQTLPPSCIDAMANFIQNGSDCKVSAAGNANETTSPLGLFCEPAPHLGGWDGGIDQTPKTKTWDTRFHNGVCIQFPGSDSPNYDVPEGEPPPFPFLMTRQRMEEDALTWGRDSWRYSMFNEGRMPRGQGSNRVITRQLCIKHGALKEPLWKNTKRTRIVGLDAAYRSVGGDRCVVATMEFGEEAEVVEPDTSDITAIISQKMKAPPKRQIIALINVAVIPLKSNDFEAPEDQIVMFVKKYCEDQNVSPKNVWFDAGMRTSLVSAFMRLWSTDVNSLDSMGRPSEMMVSDNIPVKCCDYYSKRVTEFWYSVRQIIEAGQFRGMTEDVMLEGCAREFKMVGANKIEIESKKEMKEKSNRSPDLMDCIAYCCHGARNSGFQIRRLGTPQIIEQDHRWKKDLKDKYRKAQKERELTYT